MKPTNFLHAYYFAGMIAEGINKVNPDFGKVTDHINLSELDFIAKISKPHKETILHEVIDSVVSNVYDYMTGHSVEMSVDYIRSVFEENCFSLPSWLNEDEIELHIRELDELFVPIIKKISEVVFYLLFSDRIFCYKFQAIISSLISNIKKVSCPILLRKDGVLNRPKHIPTWLKKAIFYRDKGRCQLCYRDITGLLLPNVYELDHMIPLANSGSNDPTNFQLICPDCNRSKYKKRIIKPQLISSYW